MVESGFMDIQKQTVTRKRVINLGVRLNGIRSELAIIFITFLQKKAAH